MKKIKNWKALLISIVVVFAVGFVGSLFTSPNTSTSWYSSIKPAITPPNFVFPIVWNLLFFLIALSLYFSWMHSNRKNKEKIIWVFGINFFLNIFWSVLFFSLKIPVVSFFELVLLWFSILSMMFVVKKINKAAFYLLIPYLAWVAFAGVLNFLVAFG